MFGSVRIKIATMLRSLTAKVNKTKNSINSEPEFITPKQRFVDLEPEFRLYYKKVIPYTMTSTERLYALYKSIEYICKYEIPGAFVECGVWKGGSSMLGALGLIKHNDINREMYLYDTFSGMSKPNEMDVKYDGEEAFTKWMRSNKGNINLWDFSPLEEVKRNIFSTGYPRNLVKFIVGKVEDTIPHVMPQQISILRLDTDWYESTYHELTHLFPLVSPGGIIIIDDYGHWQGAKKAVDKYFSEMKKPIFLHRIDYTGRLIIKPYCHD